MPATRERNLDLDLRDGFEWRVACVAGAEKGEIIRKRGGNERKGEEGSHADLPAPFYNYVECKLRNTNKFVQSERSIGPLIDIQVILTNHDFCSGLGK